MEQYGVRGWGSGVGGVGKGVRGGGEKGIRDGCGECFVGGAVPSGGFESDAEGVVVGVGIFRVGKSNVNNQSQIKNDL